MGQATNIWAKFEQNAHKTFGEAAAKYLNEFTGKDLTRQIYALRSLEPYIGNHALIDVDNDALAQFKKDRRSGHGAFSKPAMAGTINKELTTATTVLNKACRVWRWLPSAPKLEHVTGATRMPYPLDWDEQDALFGFLPDKWAQGAALFAVNTGVRKAELFGLKWSHLRVAESLGTIVFILEDTKNGHDRAVICNSLARTAVDEQRNNGSDFVFPVSDSNKIWRTAWEMAGLPSNPLIRKGIHNLRHTFGYRLRNADVPEEDRNALLGHCNSNLSQHYATPAIGRLTAMAERVTVRKDDIILRKVNMA